MRNISAQQQVKVEYRRPGNSPLTDSIFTGNTESFSFALLFTQNSNRQNNYLRSSLLNYFLR